jgi:hypothetical protein
MSQSYEPGDVYASHFLSTSPRHPLHLILLSSNSHTLLPSFFLRSRSPYTSHMVPKGTAPLELARFALGHRLAGLWDVIQTIVV